MSNTSIVSSVKGTILNYFGLGDSYNPFTNENALQVVTNLDFEIPAVEPFVNAGYVAVSTGLLTTSLSFLNDGNLAIYDTDRTTKIADLTNVIGELGNNKYMPKENQVFWFNKDGLRGTYFLNSAYAGKILRIISGRYVTTAITSGVLNDMFERTSGVPSYIENINNSINDINKEIEALKNDSSSTNITDIYTQPIKMPYLYNSKQVYRIFYKGKTYGNNGNVRIVISTPNRNNISIGNIIIMTPVYKIITIELKNGEIIILINIKEGQAGTFNYSVSAEYTEN